jgi:hypothetical protein
MGASGIVGENCFAVCFPRGPIRHPPRITRLEVFGRYFNSDGSDLRVGTMASPCLSRARISRGIRSVGAVATQGANRYDVMIWRQCVIMIVCREICV